MHICKCIEPYVNLILKVKRIQIEKNRSSRTVQEVRLKLEDSLIVYSVLKFFSLSPSLYVGLYFAIGCFIFCFLVFGCHVYEFIRHHQSRFQTFLLSVLNYLLEIKSKERDLVKFSKKEEDIVEHVVFETVDQQKNVGWQLGRLLYLESESEFFFFFFSVLKQKYYIYYLFLLF